LEGGNRAQGDDHNERDDQDQEEGDRVLENDHQEGMTKTKKKATVQRDDH